MTYTSLNATVQNLVMYNFEMFAKFLIIFGLFFYCLYVAKTFNPSERTPFFAIRYIKGLNYLFAKIYLFMSPLTIFLIYPQVELNSLLIILTTIYGVFFAVMGFVVLPINVLLYGSAFAFELLGMNTKASGIKKKVEEVIGHDGGLP